jgi:hypothetical protein
MGWTSPTRKLTALQGKIAKGEGRRDFEPFHERVITPPSYSNTYDELQRLLAIGAFLSQNALRFQGLHAAALCRWVPSIFAAFTTV